MTMAEFLESHYVSLYVLVLIVALILAAGLSSIGDKN